MRNFASGCEFTYPGFYSMATLHRCEFAGCKKCVSVCEFTYPGLYSTRFANLHVWICNLQIVVNSQLPVRTRYQVRTVEMQVFMNSHIRVGRLACTHFWFKSFVDMECRNSNIEATSFGWSSIEIADTRTIETTNEFTNLGWSTVKYCCNMCIYIHYRIAMLHAHSRGSGSIGWTVSPYIPKQFGGGFISALLTRSYIIWNPPCDTPLATKREFLKIIHELHHFW